MSDTLRRNFRAHDAADAGRLVTKTATKKETR